MLIVSFAIALLLPIRTGIKCTGNDNSTSSALFIFYVIGVHGRLALFFADFRVPHSVMPCYVEEGRYAITAWYVCSKEAEAAVISGLKSALPVDELTPVS